MSQAFRAAEVWTGRSWLRDGTVVVDGGVIVEVREAEPGDPPALRGRILPGLVNAHCHLELSWAHGKVPGGDGLVPWVGRLMSMNRPTETRAEAAALQMATLGVAAVGDIHNGPSTAPSIARAGLTGVAQHELLGRDPAILEQAMNQASSPIEEVGGVWVRPAPHGVHSTPEPLLRAAARPGPVNASIHLAEDPEELAFVAQGSGAFAALMDRLGRDWTWDARGETPVEYLDRLELLGPELFLVHAVHVSDSDIDLIAESGATVCLCPRSNLHIGGRLPPVPAMVDAGVPLAIGTDSLASVPDLDPLAEVAALADAFPEIAEEVWLQAVTAGGADALGLPVGQLAFGLSPGVLQVHGDSRRWLVPVGG